MHENARFGPAGNSDSFYAMGHKKTEHIPDYLEKMHLNAFEYQCGRGVNIKRKRQIGWGIWLLKKILYFHYTLPIIFLFHQWMKKKEETPSTTSCKRHVP